MQFRYDGFDRRILSLLFRLKGNMLFMKRSAIAFAGKSCVCTVRRSNVGRGVSGVAIRNVRRLNWEREREREGERRKDHGSDKPFLCALNLHFLATNTKGAFLERGHGWVRSKQETSFL